MFPFNAVPAIPTIVGSRIARGCSARCVGASRGGDVVGVDSGVDKKGRSVEGQELLHFLPPLFYPRLPRLRCLHIH